MKRTAVATLAAGMLAAGPAVADYPEKPIEFIVHTNAGGLTDIGVRTWQPYMEKCLGDGAAIVVQNVPGGGGTIAFTKVATSAPDGYTMGGLNAPNMPLKAVTDGANFTIDSFDYLGTVYGSSVAWNVLKTSKYETLAQFLDAAKASPTPLQIGISNVGGDDYVANHRFMEVAGLTFQLVPLGDSAGARNALLGGHIEVVSVSTTDVAPYRDQVRTLGVAAEERSDLMPEVPTLKELGYDVIGGSYHVIGAPKGFPAEAKSKIGDCFAQVVKDEGFLADAKQRSLVVAPMDAAMTEERVRSLTEEMRKVWEKNPW